MGISIPAMIGHLHLLWWWTLANAPDGVISVYDPEEIADAVLWEGNPNSFVDALLSCGARFGAGLLDQTEDGELAIHDWEEHCGKEYKKRTKEADRLKRYRADRKTKRTESVHSTQEVRTERVQDVNDPSTKNDAHDTPKVAPEAPHEGGEEGGQAATPTQEQNDKPLAAEEKNLVFRTDGAQCTYDLRTVYVHGEIEKEIEIEKKIKTKDFPQSSASEGELEPELPEATPEKKPAKSKAVGYPPEFEEFWSHYPRKIEKQAAFKAWTAEIRKKAPPGDLIAAAKNYASHVAAERAEAKFIKHASTFLHEIRWRDWVNGVRQAEVYGQDLTDAEQKALYEKFRGEDGQYDTKSYFRELAELRRIRGYTPPS